MQTTSFESERASPLTPVVGVLSSQDVYEPVFRRLAERFGPGELRFHCELEDFAIEDDRVRSRLRSSRRRLGARGREPLPARLRRLVEHGATPARHRDGRPVRDRPLRQRLLPRRSLALDRRSPRRPLLRGSSDDARGVFQPLDGRGRWLCQISYDGSAATFASYTAERCLDWIRRAVGSPEVAAEILSVGTWTMNATVARAFRHGPGPPRRRRRAPASAHRRLRHEHRRAGRAQPGVEDRGRARGLGRSRDLLDSYDAERRPVARTNADRSLENSRMVGRINRTADGGWRRLGTGGRGVTPLRQLHRHGPRLPLRARRAGERRHRAARAERPGDRLRAHRAARSSRAAPARLERDGREISTLDLFDGAFTLLAGAQGATGATRPRRRASLGVPLHAFTWSDATRTSTCATSTTRWHDLYGVGPRGAVLVRPDGHVGWRSAGGAPTREPSSTPSSGGSSRVSAAEPLSRRGDRFCRVGVG